MHDGGRLDFSNALQNPIPQLLPGVDANVPKERTGHCAKQRLDNIEPGPVRGRVHVLEAIRPRHEVGPSFFRNRRGMVIKNDPDRTVQRILCAHVLE